jgi:hypothetical protein
VYAPGSGPELEKFVTFLEHDDYSVLSYLRGLLPGPPLELIDDLAVKAEQTFIKATNTESSLLNFILELIETLSNMANLVTALVLKWNKLIEYARWLYQKFTSEGKTHPEAMWLSWNFAIRPFIKDVKSLFSSLRNAQKRLDYLRRVNHTTTTKHFRRKDVYDPGEVIGNFVYHQDEVYQSEPVSAYTYVVRTFRMRIELESYKLDFHCQADVRFDIDDAYLDDSVGIGIVWSAMQGLYNPEAILWEACPFSWLADYFVSARQKLLHQLFDLNPLRDGVIQRACHSWKCKTSWSVYQVVTEVVYDYGGNIVTPAVTSEKLMTRHPLTVYFRHEGLPSVEEIPLRIPGWNQLANLFALLLQFGRRRRRW